MKEKKIEMKKAREMIKQNTYEKEIKNTIPEALVSNREKKLRGTNTENEQIQHRTEKQIQ